MKEQIKNSKRAYIMTLNVARSRFAVYVETPEGLKALWPKDSHKGSKAELLPYQIYCKNRSFPAFHFHITGYGFSKTYEIKTLLKDINPEIEVFTLDGFQPSHV